MKLRRGGFILVLCICAILISSALSAKVSSSKYTENYPAITCPPSTPGVNGWVSVASKKVQFRRIASKVTKFATAKRSEFSIYSDPILINGNGVTSVVSQSSAGLWSSAFLCTAAQGDQWFIGASADVTSKGHLILVNSGLSEAIVDTSVWSENGVQAGKVLSVRANAFTSVRLDSISAGQSSLALRVTPRSGRVSAFVIDERKLGLKNLGADAVNSTGQPKSQIVISGIPHHTLNGVSAPHILRLLAPGDSDAQIRVDLISRDGVFVPVGLDEKKLIRGVVTDFSFAPIISSKTFSLRIQSDQPIQASVYSADSVSGHKDFVWNTPTPPLVPMSIAVKDLSPVFVFTGDVISVSISVKLATGKVHKVRITGSDIRTWSPPKASQVVTITKTGVGVYGSALIRSSNGVASVPLSAGSQLTRASIPNSDIAVINH